MTSFGPNRGNSHISAITRSFFSKIGTWDDFNVKISRTLTKYQITQNLIYNDVTMTPFGPNRGTSHISETARYFFLKNWNQGWFRCSKLTDIDKIPNFVKFGLIVASFGPNRGTSHISATACPFVKIDCNQEHLWCRKLTEDENKI